MIFNGSSGIIPTYMADNKNVKVVEGVVEESLPATMFRVRIEGVGAPLLAHLSGKMRLHYIKIVPGDKVLVEITPYDNTRGRITRRL